MKTCSFPAIRDFDLEIFKLMNRQRKKQGFTWKQFIKEIFYKYLEYKLFNGDET